MDKTNNITGSGTGLSNAKKLSDPYSDEIVVVCHPDLGSKFILTLPTDQPCS